MHPSVWRLAAELHGTGMAPTRGLFAPAPRVARAASAARAALQGVGSTKEGYAAWWQDLAVVVVVVVVWINLGENQKQVLQVRARPCEFASGGVPVGAAFVETGLLRWLQGAASVNSCLNMAQLRGSFNSRCREPAIR